MSDPPGSWPIWTVSDLVMAAEAEAFADWYYADNNALYLDDWVDEFGQAANEYRVSETTDSFERIARRIDRRFSHWEASTAAKPPPIHAGFSDADPLLAAHRAITESGGIVVPQDGVANAASTRRPKRESAVEAARREVANLAVGPTDNDGALRLRNYLRSGEPVSTVIEAKALVLSARYEAFDDLVRAVEAGPLEGDIDGWRTVSDLALTMASDIGGSARDSAEAAIAIGLRKAPADPNGWHRTNQ